MDAVRQSIALSLRNARVPVDSLQVSLSPTAGSPASPEARPKSQRIRIRLPKNLEGEKETLRHEVMDLWNNKVSSEVQRLPGVKIQASESQRLLALEVERARALGISQLSFV